MYIMAKEDKMIEAIGAKLVKKVEFLKAALIKWLLKVLQ